MSDAFVRTGPLMEIGSYPEWAGQLVADCAAAKARVVKHPLFEQMRDNALPEPAMRNFLIGVWPVIEQFPQFMAMSLLKVRFGRTPGQDMARRYLIRNIRIEQNHADHWVEWAAAHGVSRDELIHGEVPLATHALSHWCWHTCERDTLAASIAATNYAIEGATGEWSLLVCSKDDYLKSFAPDVGKKATKWLRLHAEYDDSHPWEALEIICAIMGQRPGDKGIALLRACILKSYEYMALTLDHCLQGADVIPLRPRPAPTFSATPERRRA